MCVQLFFCDPFLDEWWCFGGCLVIFCCSGEEGVR